MIDPRQQLSRHFRIGELFPPRLLQKATAETLRLELYLAQEVCRTVLEPLRDVLGPIVINAGQSTSRGWRTPLSGAAVGSSAGSDHTLLEYNPLAAGAFDINPKQAELTAEMFRVMTEMDDHGAWPRQCRSIMYEQRGGKAWIHVGWPNFKEDSSYRMLMAGMEPSLASGRPPYVDRDTGRPCRYWHIRDRELRKPVDAGTLIEG